MATPHPIPRLLNFAEDPQNQYQTELAQVVFPVFVHVYLDFVAEGISDTGGGQNYTPNNNACASAVVRAVVDMHRERIPFSQFTAPGSNGPDMECNSYCMNINVVLQTP